MKYSIANTFGLVRKTFENLAGSKRPNTIDTKDREEPSSAHQAEILLALDELRSLVLESATFESQEASITDGLATAQNVLLIRENSIPEIGAGA